MPTPDMSDEELDRLFRGGAEAYPDEVSLSGWLQVEERLAAAEHQQLVQQQVRRRVAGWFAAELAVVALLALLWNAAPALYPTNVSTPALSAATTAPARPKPATHPAQPASQRPALPSTTPPAATGPAHATQKSAETGAAVASTAALQPTTKPSAEHATTIRTRRRGLWPKWLPVSSRAVAGTRGPKETSAPGPAAVSARGTGVAAASARSSVAAASPGVTPDAGRPATTALAPALVAESGPVTAAAQLPPADSAAAPGTASLPAAAPADSAASRVTKPKPAYRLLVGVVGGPEATAVLPGPTPRVGGIFGLNLEYRFTPRLRVRTGLVQSVKRYAARGTDYNPPSTYWTHRIPVDQVDANCRILEIPLDVRYDWAVRPGHTLYATAGVASLLMRNERYRYFYELNGNYIDRTWSISRSGNAAFSLLQLSAGLERPVGSRWTVQAEPFVKIPLGGVGFGQIKLSNSGLLLGLKYGLFRPRTATP